MQDVALNGDMDISAAGSKCPRAGYCLTNARTVAIQHDAACTFVIPFLAKAAAKLDVATLARKEAKCKNRRELGFRFLKRLPSLAF